MAQICHLGSEERNASQGTTVVLEVTLWRCADRRILVLPDPTPCETTVDVDGRQWGCDDGRWRSDGKTA